MPQDRRQDLKGKRFGRLKVLLKSEDFPKADGGKEPGWVCRCDCGKTVRVRAYTLLNGRTTSCRCRQKEWAKQRFTTHGLTRTRIYRIWNGIKTRTNNPNTIAFHCYGGRGIKMCKRWERSFENFVKDMGMPPTQKHCIDRKDCNDGYNPKNCRWVTQKEQTRNSRSNVVLALNGVSKCMGQWAEDSGVKYMTLYHRLARGWSLKKALTPRRFSRWDKDNALN